MMDVLTTAQIKRLMKIPLPRICISSYGGAASKTLRSLRDQFKADYEGLPEKLVNKFSRSVTIKAFDTNVYGNQVPPDMLFPLGSEKHRRGSSGDLVIAREAFEYSRSAITEFYAPFDMHIIVAGNGKGTGRACFIPGIEIASTNNRLVVPIFINASVSKKEINEERAEWTKQNIIAELQRLQLRFIEIKNYKGYDPNNPRPKTQVWEEMNGPVAATIKEFHHTFCDLDIVDLSELALLLSGYGRMRLGIGHQQTVKEPTDDEMRMLAQQCWKNHFFGFEHGEFRDIENLEVAAQHQSTVRHALTCLRGTYSQNAEASFAEAIDSLVHETGVNPNYAPYHILDENILRSRGVVSIFSEDTGEHAPRDFYWPSPDEMRKREEREETEPTSFVLGSVSEPTTARDLPDIHTHISQPTLVSKPIDPASSGPGQSQVRPTSAAAGNGGNGTSATSGQGRPQGKSVAPVMLPEHQPPYNLLRLLTGVGKGDSFFLAFVQQVSVPPTVVFEPSQTLKEMANQRCRAYLKDELLSEAFKDAILEAASRAPEVKLIKPDWEVRLKSGTMRKLSVITPDELEQQLDSENKTSTEAMLVNWLKTVAECYGSGTALRYMQRRNPDTGLPEISADNDIARRAGFGVARK